MKTYHENMGAAANRHSQMAYGSSRSGAELKTLLQARANSGRGLMK